MPANIWFTAPAHRQRRAACSATTPGRTRRRRRSACASLPYDPFTPFLDRHDATSAWSATRRCPTGNRQSIKQTEWTYGLMMHMSQVAGRELHLLPQHAARSRDWDQSTPQRATAWYGIRMVRDLNTNYLDPLRRRLPGQPAGPDRRRAEGQLRHLPPGRVQAAVRGAMLKDHPELAGVRTVAAGTAPAAAASAPN